MATDAMVNSHGIRWFVESIAPIKGLFFSICYVHPRCYIKYNMRHILTYKTSMEIEGNTLTDNHSIICSSWEHAKAIEYDLLNGDFGGIISYDINIEPTNEPDNSDDLPF
jgi:hypothetical protein